MTQPRHVMRLDSDPGTREVWVCDTCLYRILRDWSVPGPPLVLFEGDPNAIHSGGLIGMEVEQLPDDKWVWEND